MKRELSDALKDISRAVDAASGFYLKVIARSALGRIVIALEAGAFERTQKEFLATDLKALAEGKPVKTDLAKAVEARIEALQNAQRDSEEEALFKDDWREPGEDEIEEAVACAGSEVPEYLP